MSRKNPIRKDKTCLNCNHVVAERFCPNCGQENIETRKTFHHLFIHFFEDLTHYENAFWKTIKNLLLRPSSLTKEYLSGKRMSYLAPVRLYIFISFITFILIAIIPSNDKFVNINKAKPNKNGIHFSTKKDDKNDPDEKPIDKKEESLSAEEIKINELKKLGVLNAKDADSIGKLIKVAKEGKKIKNNDATVFGYHSVREMDSIRKIKPHEISDFEYWLNKKVLTVIHNNTTEEIIEKAKESAGHNFPKVLLIYMPIFAFFLWLFHNKKKWYYFDHGIFTLHYFSFLLLIILLLFLSNKLLSIFENYSFISFLQSLIMFIAYCWMFYYFFPEHHRFYGETRWISFIKSVCLFFINMFFISIILILFFAYTLITLH